GLWGVIAGDTARAAAAPPGRPRGAWRGPRQPRPSGQPLLPRLRPRPRMTTRRGYRNCTISRSCTARACFPTLPMRPPRSASWNRRSSLSRRGRHHRRPSRRPADARAGRRTAALLQDVAAELGEYLGDLAQEGVAVGGRERPQILPVPAPVPGVPGPRPVGQRRYFGTEARVQEERERQPAVTAEVADPVRCRPVPAAGEAVEHVTDVADQRARDRWGIDPALRRGNLQPAAVVL